MKDDENMLSSSRKNHVWKSQMLKNYTHLQRYFTIHGIIFTFLSFCLCFEIKMVNFADCIHVHLLQINNNI